MSTIPLIAVRGFGAAFALLALSGIAADQYTQRPTITSARDLIEIPPERLQVDAPAVFKINNSAAASRLARQGIVVRIFSMVADQKFPVPIAQSDGCDIFLSVQHQLVVSDFGELKFATINSLNRDWLYLSNSLNSVEPGHYYFVFEQSKSIQNHSEQFRIKSSDARKYFETGFRITIDPSGQSISADSLRKQFLERSARIGKLKVEIDKKTDAPPCYSYQSVTVQARSPQPLNQGILLACAPVNWRNATANNLDG